MYLHFGCGNNLLPEPWQNLDASHDIRKRLRFDSGSVKAILAEHVVEHVPMPAALDFFGECFRVLEQGGTVRVAFPDVGRFGHWLVRDGCVRFELNDSAHRYAVKLRERPGLEAIRDAADPTRAALRQMLTGWGHQMAWTEHSAAAALYVAGFRLVKYCLPNQGQISGVDGHHAQVGRELAEIETTILEATKG